MALRRIKATGSVSRYPVVTQTQAAPPGPAAPGEFRPNAAYPLPPLRPVADFVAMPGGRRYVTVQSKFAIAQCVAGGWTIVAIVVSLAFLRGLTGLVPWPYAVLLLSVVVYLPAYFAAFRCVALMLDDPPPLKVVRPTTPVTVVMPAGARKTELIASLAYLAAQDFDGLLRVVLVDSGEADRGDAEAWDQDVIAEARRAALRLAIALDVVSVPGADLATARNAGLAAVATPLVLMAEPGAYLHPSAVRLLVGRLLSSPPDTAGVSGHALVRNREDSSFGEVLAADLALQTHELQRVHGLFQGPLVAEASCSVYKTDAVRAVNGWPTGAAQDVVLTWRFLERGWRMYHETLGLVFTTGSVTFVSAARRRARATWGLLAAMRESSLGRLRFSYSRFLAGSDATVPLRDLLFTVGWVQALVFLLFGQFSLVGWYLLFVLPLSVGSTAIVRRYHREVLDETGLTVTREGLARVSVLLTVQAIQAPIAVWAYLRELRSLRDVEAHDVTLFPIRRRR